MTVKITLACTECKQRNYNTTKNKKNNPDRLEMKKYCRFCKKKRRTLPFSVSSLVSSCNSTFRLCVHITILTLPVR